MDARGEARLVEEHGAERRVLCEAHVANLHSDVALKASGPHGASKEDVRHSTRADRSRC